MFILQNLVSSAIVRGTPWTFRADVPPEVREDKKARDKWICTDTTKWNVYSLVEGIAENLRVSLATTAVKEGNPPYRLHGFAADYDAPIPDEDVMKAIAKMSYKPRWMERTLSGNVRLIWLFEKPMLVPSAKFLEAFLAGVLEFFPADKWLPALDLGAWKNCTRYYTNSGDWKEIEGAHDIPYERVLGWVVNVGAKFNWIKESGAVEIPIDVLKPELLKKYPRFAEWPGDFIVGEQGPSFWINDSTSPKSALVRETGLQTFSAHATQAFYSWGDLLGSQFVKDYQADSIGRAVDGIYHDGKAYWRLLDGDSGGLWRPFEKGDIREFLRCSRGVSTKPDKQGISDLDRALQHIQSVGAIVGAGPFVGRPDGVFIEKGYAILNRNTRKVLRPSGRKEIWGPTGNFPFLSRYFDRLFGSAEQLPFFLAWLSYFYASYYKQNPRSGQAVFIAGDPGVGKTFLSQGLLPRLMGGGRDASDVLLGKTQFGSEMFEVPLWTIDDGVYGSALRIKQHFTETVKSMTANRNHMCKEKFRVPCEVLWQGRCMITLNLDARSTQGLPDLEGNILDKLMMFTTCTTEEMSSILTLTQDQMEEMLTRELPAFAQFLLDYVMEPQCVGDARFGVKSYHEPTLVASAEQSSYTSGFAQILEDWCYRYFEILHKADPPKHWEGNAYQLKKELGGIDPMAQDAMRNYDVNRIGRDLASLQNKGHAIAHFDLPDRTRLWRIMRPKPLTDRSQIPE
jgi:hypothetical protein